MKKYILIFIFILFICPNVFAQDFSVGSTITIPNCSGNSCVGGKYKGLEIYNTGQESTYNVGTRYNGRLSRITFNIPVPSTLEGGAGCYSVGDITYTLTLNMDTKDWRNHFAKPFISTSSSGSNFATSNMTYVSYYKVYFKFKIPTTDNCIENLYVDLKSTDLSNTAFTGVSNWDLSKVVLSMNLPSSGGSSGGSGGSSNATPTPSPNIDLSPIIDNQNSNTQDIIDSQNSNTQDIIENNNQNTQDIIDNQNNLLGSSCPNLINKLPDGPKRNCVYTDINSVLCTGFDSDTYFKIFNLTSPTDDDYVLSFTANGVNNYDIHYSLWTNAQSFKLVEGVNTIKIPKNTNLNNARLMFDNNGGITLMPIIINFTDFILSKGNTYVPYCAFGSTTSKLDETTNAINNLNDTMKDDSVDDKTSFFTNFDSNSHGLTGIITLPLSTIQTLTNSSCVPLSIPIPFTSRNINLPCMTEVYQTYIPSVFNIWQVVSFGIISYLICLDIFKMVKGFKDPNEDKIEVLDL